MSQADQGVWISPQQTYQTAQKLIRSQKWDHAAYEFERFLDLFPNHALAEPSLFYGGQALLGSRNYESGIHRLKSLLTRYPHSSFRGRAMLMIAQAYESWQKPDQALAYFQLAANSVPSDRLKDESQLHLSRLKLQQGRFSEFQDHLMALSPTKQSQINLPEIRSTFDQLQNLPKKDPGTAGFLALIPGLGHVYCQRYRDGAIAFMINLALTAAAVEAFDQDMTALGAIFTALEVSAYTGNVFSAVNAAHRYNRRQKNDLIQKILNRLNLHLSARPRESKIAMTLVLPLD